MSSLTYYFLTFSIPNFVFLESHQGTFLQLGKVLQCFQILWPSLTFSRREKPDKDTPVFLMFFFLSSAKGWVVVYIFVECTCCRLGGSSTKSTWIFTNAAGEVIFLINSCNKNKIGMYVDTVIWYFICVMFFKDWTANLTRTPGFLNWEPDQMLGPGRRRISVLSLRSPTHHAIFEKLFRFYLRKQQRMFKATK